jgi:type VI secretion system protein ImpD
MNAPAASTVPGVQVLSPELPAAPTAPRAKSLLEMILEAPPSPGQAPPMLERFLREPSVAKALRDWLGPLPNFKDDALRRYIADRLNHDIAQLDALLNEQVNAILHHRDLQKLEASWRSLKFLVDQTPEGANVKIKVLNASWKDLTRDLTVKAIEFDQSDLFRKVYNDAFGIAGGEPFSVLIGDYEIRHRITPDHPYNDLDTLDAISGVAAASFAPFITAAHPSILELNDFADLERPLDLTRTFDSLEYLKWKAFRKKEDARFVGLTLPHVLARLPYTDDSGRTDGFRFREDVSGPDRSKYLWGNAAYAFGGVLIRAFVETGWLADIRGARRGELSGGLVEGLPIHSFSTDKRGVAPKSSTNAIVTDAQEKELGMLGFIPLCHCQDTELAAFYGNASVQQPLEYDKNSATLNARMSAMLQYILCASRFAHYLKVMARDRIGSFARASDFQNYLRQWIMNYTTANDKAGSKHPLREAKVEVEELLDRPGTFACRIFLRPHHQLDQMTSMLKLESTLAPMRQ